ncbi:acyl-CoA dehydrogenase family protein [Nitriliruptor alkaliphilus]|uniref:acyl-CoA dehydrogenase family protein n=1 Tax=Nitriliruptor alkaliphilus TaxID=427918 RepID=UPI00069915FF|nr:acyl-CoA dehydrogenase family protein [Nitriliruptor alkaliphilus]
MNFDLDETELALQQGIRGLYRGRFPVERLRATEGRVDRDLWRELAEAGVFSLRLPEADGGTGARVTDAAVVFEELGRALVHGPVLGTHLAAGLVDGAADGGAVVGLVEAERSPLVVEHADDLDALLVLHRGEVTVTDAAGLPTQAAPRPLDPLTPVSHVTGPLPHGTVVGDAALARQLRRTAAVLRAAQLVGLAGTAMDLAVRYAGEREQFGRPIGGFQAIKHLCADMLARTEVARAAVHAAAVHLGSPDDAELGDLDRAIAGAVLLAGEAAKRNGKAGIQVHGGMGFTWEVDAHLPLKRAAVLCALDGGLDAQAERVAATL